ncbi:MAG: hypothetical protein GXO07_04500 [Crenarchaeota archaeon]|nr:hypothetical protein [Thermoproteota archaeon]
MSYASTSPAATRCPTCGNVDLVRNEVGDYVCPVCGTVVLEASEVEFDSFEGYDSNNQRLESRASLTRARHDKGLGSQITGGRGKYRLLAKTQDRIKFGNERESFLGDVKKGIEEFSSLISRTLVPVQRYIIEDAYNISDYLVTVYDKLPRKLRRTSIEARRLVGLAILLAVIKEYGSYLPPEIVLNKLGLDPKKKREVKEMYTYLHNSIVKKKISAQKDAITKMKESAVILLNYLKNDAGIEPERDTLILEAVEKILLALESANRGSLGSKLASSYLGGAMYLALRVLATSPRAMLTQDAIAKVLAKGPNSLRSAYVEILNKTLVVVEVPAKPPRNKSRRRKAR